MFAKGDPDQAYSYYLNGGTVDGKTFKPVAGASVPFVRDWGLKLELDDLRNVVLKARDGGRRQVILGGHSLGGSTTVAYAAWDFNGHPGYKDLSGMVLIDGGLLGSFATPSLAAVKKRLAALKKGDPFVDLLGLGIPWAAGAFSEIAALYAQKKPNEPAVLQQYPLIPRDLRPPVPATNEAALGYAFDAIHLAGVALADPGARRAARGIGRPAAVAGRGAHAAVAAGGGLRQRARQRGGVVLPRDACASTSTARTGSTATPSSNFLHLREFHRGQVDIPLYAFETGLTHGRVLRGAREVREGLEGAALDVGGRPRPEPPRPAVRGSVEEPLPADRGAVPEGPPLSGSPGHMY